MKILNILRMNLCQYRNKPYDLCIEEIREKVDSLREVIERKPRLMDADYMDKIEAIYDMQELLNRL